MPNLLELIQVRAEKSELHTLKQKGLLVVFCSTSPCAEDPMPGEVT